MVKKVRFLGANDVNAANLLHQHAMDFGMSR